MTVAYRPFSIGRYSNLPKEYDPQRTILTVGEQSATYRFQECYEFFDYSIRVATSPSDVRRFGCVGVLLQGGPDVSPDLYDEPVTFARGMVPERDSLEFQLLQKALDLGLPVLGVCRGAQILNVFYGGNLFQDLEEEGVTDQSHWGGGHFAHGKTGSALRGKHYVNSWHHQAVHKVASGFEVLVVSPDGVVEAIDDGFQRLGVQWHPESHRGPVSEEVFALHVDRIERYKAHRRNRRK